MTDKKESKESLGRDNEANKAKNGEQYTWLEDFLALINLKKSITTVKEAKNALREIESSGDTGEKKKKTGLLTTVLKDLVKKEGESAVGAKKEEELRKIGEDGNLNLDRLDKWIDGWAKDEEAKDLKAASREFADPQKRKEVLEKTRIEQSREKMELSNGIEKLSKKLEVDRSPEIEDLKEELREVVSEVRQTSIPVTVDQLKETKKSIVEWTRKLKKEEWNEIIKNSPDADRIPGWVKKIVKDENIEAYKQKAVINELTDGVKAIDTLQQMLSKGLSLEDAVWKLSIEDRDSFHKIYKKDIYKELRNNDKGIRELLTRVESVRNPWVQKNDFRSPEIKLTRNTHRDEVGGDEYSSYESIPYESSDERKAQLGKGGRTERVEESSPGLGSRNANLSEVERLLKKIAGERIDQEIDQETADAMLVDAFSPKNRTEFQIFNNVDYNILSEDIKKFIDYKDWNDSRGGSPAFVNKETLANPEKMEAFKTLWRDRTRLALRKIAYQQSESRQDPVMAELTTLLSIIGIPSSEKGMIKIEMQIYGMVDALMRGEGNKETFAKLFSLFTSNGVGFRLIENLKKHREKVYWVKEGVYSGDSDPNATEKMLELLSTDSEQLRAAKIKYNQHLLNDPRRATEILNDKGDDLRMSVFDFMKEMGKRVSVSELQELQRLGYFTESDLKSVGGDVTKIKMMWGTMIYRKSVDADIDIVKKEFMRKVLGKRGKTYNKAEQRDAKFGYSTEFEDVYAFYGDYIDEAVYFKSVHGEIDGIVGNASLENGSYEFAAGLKEYLQGKLSIQGARYFEAKYGNGNVDEMVGLLDGGVRSIAVMARTEVVNHFIGESATTEGNLGAKEVFFSKVADSGLRDKLTKNWNKLWKEALYHHGNFHKIHHDPTNMFTSFGDEGSIDSGLLRPTWNTIDVLNSSKNKPEVQEIINNIDYGEFAKIVHDSELSNFLNNPNISPQAKFDKFIDQYGEDYRSYSGEKSKRWSDWPVKYWISKLDEAFSLIQELSTDPYSVAVQKKLLDLYTSTNAGGTAAYQRMMQEAIEWYAKDVGVFGTFKKYKRKIDGDRVTVVFDKSKGIYGDDQEFPGIASVEAGGLTQKLKDKSMVEELENKWREEDRVSPKSDEERQRHNREMEKLKRERVPSTVFGYVKGVFLGDPSLKSNSLASSHGHGSVGEWTMRQMLLERRAAGYYKNQEQFSKEWGKWARGILWNTEKSLVENGWNWVTLNAPFEYIGMVYFGIQGHKFREIFMEESEKSIEKMMHYLNH